MIVSLEDRIASGTGAISGVVRLYFTGLLLWSIRSHPNSISFPFSSQILIASWLTLNSLPSSLRDRVSRSKSGAAVTSVTSLTRVIVGRGFFLRDFASSLRRLTPPILTPGLLLVLVGRQQFSLPALALLSNLLSH